MSDSRHYTYLGLEQLRLLAHYIAGVCEPVECITLKGELGAGKTTFAGFFIRHLCDEDVTVTSPTFTLSQSYALKPHNGKVNTLWHYDLYRLKHRLELEETGLGETLENTVNLIEWPDIAEHWLPARRLHITIAFADKPDYRNVTLTGDESWMQRLPLQMLLS